MQVYYDKDADLSIIQKDEGSHRGLRFAGPCPRQ